MRRGIGVAVIDPHGDLVETLARIVPPSRTNDVILFDPSDTAFPIAFNLLRGRSGYDRSLIASSVLVAFKKIWADSWGPRLEHFLRNALLALLEIPDTSLLQIPRLFTDAKFRSDIASRLTDPVVRDFWTREFASLPPKLQSEASAPVLNKAGAFLVSPILRNVLGQPANRLDLRRVMDSGSILLANLSKGRIGEDVSSLLGSLLVTELQLAAMSRADVAEGERRDFSVYVDEFQNFATESFATILSEARKYHVRFTLAHQYLAQLDPAIASAIFGNVGNLVAFAVGRDAEELAEHLGGDLTAEDLRHLPKFTAYARILIDGVPTRPFSMATIPPTPRADDPTRAATIRRLSRQRYARSRESVEAIIHQTLR